MLVGERRVQSTVDRYSLLNLIPFRAIAGLRFNILQILTIAAHFKCLLELQTTSAAGGLQRRGCGKLSNIYTCCYLAEKQVGKSLTRTTVPTRRDQSLRNVRTI